MIWPETEAVTKLKKALAKSKAERLQKERKQTAKVKPSDALEVLIEDLTWWKIVWFSTKCSFLLMMGILISGVVVGVPLWLLWQLFFVVLA